MFQNKFEIRIFENGRDIILGAGPCWKTCSAVDTCPNAARTGLIWNKPD